MRVLVVDDYQSIANALCRHLRARGHEARAVYSGSIATTEAAAFQPELELVLVDVTASRHDGLRGGASAANQGHGPALLAISSCPPVVDANIYEYVIGIDRFAAIVDEAAKRATQ